MAACRRKLVLTEGEKLGMRKPGFSFRSIRRWPPLPHPHRIPACPQPVDFEFAKFYVVSKNLPISRIHYPFASWNPETIQSLDKPHQVERINP